MRINRTNPEQPAAQPVQSHAPLKAQTEVNGFEPPEQEIPKENQKEPPSEGGGRRPEGANLATARNISDYIRLSPPPPAGGAPSQRGPGLQQHPEIRIGHGEGAA